MLFYSIKSFVSYAEAEDLYMDIPLFWAYLANILAPVVVQCPQLLHTITNNSEGLHEIGKAATFVAEVLKAIHRNEGQVCFCKKSLPCSGGVWWYPFVFWI